MVCTFFETMILNNKINSILLNDSCVISVQCKIVNVSIKINFRLSDEND